MIDPRIRRRDIHRSLGLAAAALGLGTAVTGCSDESGVVTLNFFQFKGEALEDFNAIIADFEAANPDIRVVQNQVAESETAIRTMLVREDVPDVITLNANGGLGQLMRAGVFHDFSGDPLVDEISPLVQDILADIGFADGEVNALGYVNNANGIVYNRTIFEEQGLEVPETWDELIAVCERLKAAGITPFYGSLGDAASTLPSFNALGAYPAGDDFFDRMRDEGEDVGPDSPVSFEADFPGALERQSQLYGYTQEGSRGGSYDEGNAAFANGEVAMHLQGIWSLSPIQDMNPDIDASMFPYPWGDDPDERMLVSGVDVAVLIGRDTPHFEEAHRFVEYLFDRGVMEEFAASQNMIPSLEAAEWSDGAALQALKPFFDEERITGFIDHQIPPSIPLASTIQQAMLTGDHESALATLDQEWANVAARTTESGD
jgi:raffinose/stachyose/melibiose transport system substrate-binding protein